MAKKHDPTPGERLRAARLTLGLTQAKMAARLELTVDTISKWERADGGRVVPRAYLELAELLAAQIRKR